MLQELKVNSSRLEGPSGHSWNGLLLCSRIFYNLGVKGRDREIDYIICGLIKPPGGLSMLVEPSLDELLTKVDNKFELVTLALKRARQINDGDTSIEHYNAAKPVSMALQEIAKGEVYVDESGDDQPSAATTSKEADIMSGEGLAASLSGVSQESKSATKTESEETISIDDLSSGGVDLEDFVAKEDDSETSIDELTSAVDSASKADEAVDFVSEKTEEKDSLI